MSGSTEFLMALMLAFIALLIFLRKSKGNDCMDKYICIRCHTVGQTEIKKKGHFLIECILWLCILIPGIIYSIWRIGSKYRVCMVCASTEIVPLDSPVGRKILEESLKDN